LRPSERGRGLRLDLRPAVRLDLWAITLALGVGVGTVAPALVPAVLVACALVSAGAFVWRGLVPEGWRLMAVLAPLFAAGGAGIAAAHAGAPDPLTELAGLEPGEVIIVGRVASPAVESGYGYRADVRVEHLWHEGREVLRGGGVEVFAGDLSVGVGDRVRVDGEISLPDVGEDGFDYARYLSTKRISAVVEATGVYPVGEERGWIGRIHRRTDAALGHGLRPTEAAVVRGMVLGDRSLISEELEAAFQRSGVTHAWRSRASTSRSWPRWCSSGCASSPFHPTPAPASPSCSPGSISWSQGRRPPPSGLGWSPRSCSRRSPSGVRSPRSTS